MQVYHNNQWTDIRLTWTAYFDKQQNFSRIRPLVIVLKVDNDKLSGRARGRYIYFPRARPLNLSLSTFSTVLIKTEN